MSQPKIVAELEPLFTPRSVAVIGATNNLTKWGFSTFYSLMRHYRGNLYPVNIRSSEILGQRAYARVTDIPGPVDLAVIVIPPEKVAGVMAECAEKKVKASIIITAGFAEVGAQGKAMQDEVMKIARQGGIRVVGPNCMGMWSATANLTAFMFPLPIIEGPLSLVSQGGNVGGALVSDAVSRGVGFRHYVSCGCTADIQIEDYIEYMGYDDAVKVIMVYIEGLSDGERFIKKVRPVTLKKPVIALKPGKTDAAARAIISHSGALSGSDFIYDAAFKKAGVIRVNTTMELLDVAIGLLTQPLPRGRNVVITTPGGSYGVMCADACASLGLKVIDLPPDAMETFNAMFPSRWSHGNPVDPAGDRNLIQYLKAPDILLRYPEVDALIFMGFGSFSGISAMLTSAGGLINERLKNMKADLKNFSETARVYIETLNSGDASQIKEIIKIGLGLIFGSVMTTKVSEVEEFLDMVSDALITKQMRQSSFFEGMKRLFISVAEGDLNGTKMADIMELMTPMLDAVIHHWIQKYKKPVITTTFSEGTSRIGEGGHFPYSNAERASKVLAKLVEYSEYLARDEKEQ